jgi:carbonic anhydrase
MRTLKKLIENNQKWAGKIKTSDPDFFKRLTEQQTPEYLWIGCSDSRVPANEIVGLPSGELFVHRNVANIVVHTDLNCLSVIQYAVEVLKVKHIIVCGHYGCGGVHAGYKNQKLGLIDNWLRHTQDVMEKHKSMLSKIENEKLRFNNLCELNVIEQVVNVAQTTVVQQAWDKEQELSVHGWIYGLHNGLLNDLNICITNNKEISEVYRSALYAVENRKEK